MRPVRQQRAVCTKAASSLILLPRRMSCPQVVASLLPPLRLEDPLSLAASISTSPQRSPHHRSPQRSPTLRATGASAASPH